MADNVTNNKIITSVELDVDQAAIDIVKLNSLASDSTKELSDRVDAKNKQVKIQNDLNKKIISDLEKQVKSLENVKGKEKEYEKAKAKLVKAKLNEVKVTEKNSKAQAKLTSQYGKSKGAMNKLNKATGGMIDRLKLLALNPIVLFFTILIGSLKLLKEAFTSSEEGQNKWAKAIGIIEALLGNLLDLVANLAEGLVDMVTKPKAAWESFIGALKTGYDIWKTQVLDRFLGNLKILSGTFQKGILKMRIAWNEFTGDSKEAEELEKALDKVNKKIEEGYEANRIANKQLVDGYNKAKDALSGFVEEQKKEGAAAGKVADMRAKADKIERDLIVRRSELVSKIAQARLNAKKEEEFSAKERKAFLEEAQKLEDELIDKETTYLELRRDAQILENTFSRTNKENKTKEAEAIAAVNNQVAKRAKASKKLQTELNTVNKQIATEDKKLAKEVSDFKKGLEIEELESLQEKAEREKEEALIKLETLKVTEDEKAQLKLDIEAKYREDSRLAKFDQDVIDGEFQLEQDEIELEAKRLKGEATLAEELKFLEKKRDQELLIAGDDKKKKILIEKEYGATKAKIQKIAADAEKKRQEDLLNAGIAAAAEAFGVGKELSIATALVNTYKGISEVWSSKSETGLVGAGFLQKVATSAVTALQGFNTVKRIIGTKGPRGSKSSSRGGGFSAAASAAPTSVGSTDIANISSNNASRLGTDTSLSTNANQAALASTSVSGGGSNVVFSETAYSNFQNQVGFREDRTTIGG
tara:strand:+ start:846 stop:3119 length:2274 start_codon:yes stop_codon:yes gene_type:complete